MIRQNRRIGGGGKPLVNLGKLLLSAVILSALFFGVDVEAGRRSSKRSGSSQRGSSQNSGSRSSKRSGSSQRGSSKRSGSNRRSKRSASSQHNVAPVTDGAEAEAQTSTVATSTTDISSSFYEELKAMITTLQGKVDSMDKRIVELESKPVTTTATTTASTSSTTSSASKSTLSELGYIKGSTDLCKPDSSGHKFCSVAINVDKKFNNGTYCFAWNYDEKFKLWKTNMNMHGLYTTRGDDLKINDFVKDKPSLFAMTDFSFYTDSIASGYTRLHQGKTVVFCGDGLGASSIKNADAMQILDGDVYVGAKTADATGKHNRSVKPFTASDGSMILFDGENGKPLLRYNMKQNLLEYKPQLSDDYIASLRSYEAGYDYYIDIRGTKYDSFNSTTSSARYNKTEKTSLPSSLSDGEYKLGAGCYDFTLLGGGGGTRKNKFASWGELGAHGGKLKLKACVKSGTVVAKVTVGKGGGSDSSGSASTITFDDKGGVIESSVKAGYTYKALGGSAGTGNNGAKKNGSRKGGAGCETDDSGTCTTGGAGNGGSQGNALSSGGSGGNGSVTVE